MIDLEIIQSQINSLQRCVDNCKSAESNLHKQKNRHYSNEEDDSDIIDASDMVISTQQTLAGQLRVMNYQNEKLLK